MVQAIPKLPAANSLLPADRTVYGPAELRVIKGITFSWSAVPGAQEYVVRIFEDPSLLALASPVPKAKTPIQPVQQFTVKSPNAKLEKLNVLKRGSYYWEVEAHTLGADGLVEQEGVVARSYFKIDLPDLGQPKLPDGQVFYGR